MNHKQTNKQILLGLSLGLLLGLASYIAATQEQCDEACAQGYQACADAARQIKDSTNRSDALKHCETGRRDCVNRCKDASR